MEGRGAPEHGTADGKDGGTLGPENISTKQQRVAQLARQIPRMVLTTLSHHIDMEWMKEAFQRTRKDAATGVDGQTAQEFEQDLEGNLSRLLELAKSGEYRAPPVRRVNIPKGDGTATRPIGIPTFGDKVLQRAVVMLLEPVYEQDFRDCSYGFRPGRSAHGALESFWSQMMSMNGGWVVEVDVEKFFDMLDHKHLQEFVRQRVNDGVVKRLIGKWLNAGVQEEGGFHRPTTGTPQGGVISPLLANIYLHEVLDVWFEDEVKLRLRGKSFLVRYADDFVMGFSEEADAKRVLEVLSKRFGKYGLTVHPTKTRLVDFRRPRPQGPGPGYRPGNFDLLGFTHYWSLSRKGNWVIKRKTAKGRFKRALKAMATWCRRAMHLPMTTQHRTLSQKLKGHNGYYGITGNAEALDRFRSAVRRAWQRALGRRSQKGMNWERFKELEKRFKLPPAIAIHSELRRTARP